MVDDEADATNDRGSPPALPTTWRPVRTRRVTLGFAVAVMACVVVVAAALPSAGGRPWPVLDRFGIVLIGALVAAVLLMLARPRLSADEDGLVVVNLLRSRRLQWAEVVAVSFREGDPWVMLDLADGSTLAVMGIQASGGLAARRAAGELRALVAARSSAREDD
ncbi:MAG: PH domain-containing protein [Actinomycetes bacterium]